MPAWSETDTIELLLAVIDETWSSPPAWKNVAEKMSARNHPFTAEAIRQRVQKLRKDYHSATPSSTTTITSTPVTPTATPRKRKPTSNIKTEFKSSKVATGRVTKPSASSSAMVGKKRAAGRGDEIGRRGWDHAGQGQGQGENGGDLGENGEMKMKTEFAEWVNHGVRVKTERVDVEGRVLLDDDDDLYE